MAKLQKALAHLKGAGVKVEDPGDEIGPEPPGSANRGLWFHDPDGYRWELSVLGGGSPGPARGRADPAPNRCESRRAWMEPR
jgi:hypothetical protein